MKSKLAILALVIVCMWGRAASADTITTGDLSFTVRAVGMTAPTSGSFVFDNTNDQFLSFTLVWDGITFGFSGLTEANYLALTGQGSTRQEWTGECEPGLGFPFNQFACDTLLDFQLFLLNGNTVSDVLGATILSIHAPALDGGTAPALATGTGDIIAVNLHTPEPTADSLLLLGIGFAFALREGGSIFLRKRAFHS